MMLCTSSDHAVVYFLSVEEGRCAAADFVFTTHCQWWSSARVAGGALAVQVL